MFTNKGWRVFSEDVTVPYLKETSSGKSVPEPVDRIFVDLCLTNAFAGPDRCEVFEIDGLSIEVPRHDVSALLTQLENQKATLFGETKLFKLRGDTSGVVLNPHQRLRLVEKMLEAK